jgi:small subunit ribosomal protein S8
MSVTDPIGDMLTRIRNAQQRGKSTVSSPSSRLRERVLEVLQAEGYIRSFRVTQQGNGQAELEVELKYFDGEPVIRELKRVSKPGRRVYASVTDLPTIYNGLGVAIMSTSKGVMSDSDAREQNVGGEVLCTVF